MSDAKYEGGFPLVNYTVGEIPDADWDYLLAQIETATYTNGTWKGKQAEYTHVTCPSGTSYALARIDPKTVLALEGEPGAI